MVGRSMAPDHRNTVRKRQKSGVVHVSGLVSTFGIAALLPRLIASYVFFLPGLTVRVFLPIFGSLLEAEGRWSCRHVTLGSEPL